LYIGGTYTYNDYRYKEFIELVGYGTKKAVSRNGNRMVYSPAYMYSIFAGYKSKKGFKTRIQTDSWGSYYLDPANSEKYDGYTFVTKAMIGYEYKNLDFTVNADNILNKRYAIEVKKASTTDNTGEKTYSPAPTFSLLATVSYKF